VANRHGRENAPRRNTFFQGNAGKKKLINK
jgi:hypothetical protein